MTLTKKTVLALLPLRDCAQGTIITSQHVHGKMWFPKEIRILISTNTAPAKSPWSHLSGPAGLHSAGEGLRFLCSLLGCFYL